MKQSPFDDMPDTRGIDRRRLLQFAMAVPIAWSTSGRALAAAVQQDQSAAAQDALKAERTLSLVNTHTGESLATRYFAGGRYLDDALSGLNVLLRDHRSNEISAIDPRLFDLLNLIADRADREPHFEVISGYRSPASNALLHAHSSGVAQGSLHMQGKAIDVRLSGVKCSRVRDLALDMACGGVGYYRKSDFVHLDTGRIRSWKG